jgi:S-adenosylmethionine decarboxylase
MCEKVDFREIAAKIGLVSIVCFFHGCDPDQLEDSDEIRAILSRFVELARMQTIDSFFHKFTPQGLTGVFILHQSHVFIHTWPEFSFAIVQISVCQAKHFHLRLALRYLKNAIKHGNCEIRAAIGRDQFY